MYFLALSQAPPELEDEMATWTPLTMAPASRPETPLGPRKTPVTMGAPMTIIPGRIMEFSDALVEMVMQRL